MKAKHLLAVIMTLILAAGLFTACGSKEPADLESYVKNNSEVQAEIDKALGGEDAENITVDIKGNEVIYNFDFSSMEGVTEELAKSEELKSALAAGLEGQADTFKNIAAELSKSTGIEGISVTVNYNYGDEVIATANFVPDPEE